MYTREIAQNIYNIVTYYSENREAFGTYATMYELAIDRVEKEINILLDENNK